MRMKRIDRRVFGLGLGAAVIGAATAQVTKREMRWVQLGTHTGINGAATRGLVLGGQLALRDVNARGGMFGRRIEIETVDTGGDTQSTGEAIAKVRQRDDLFGAISVRGTAETMAVARGLPGWPIFGPSTGADPVRRATPPNVFYTRVGWGAEIDRLMAVAKSIGISRIGVVYPEGPAGQAALGLLDPTVKKHGLTVSGLGSIPDPGSTDVGPAVAKLAATNVQMVVVALAGPAPDFILAARRAGMRVPMYTLSDAVGPEFLFKLKDQSKGIGMSSALPSPWDRSMLVVRDYQQAMQETKRSPSDYSFASMEGYINGRLLIEVLKRLGPDPTREQFIDGARSLKLADMGGLNVDFTKSNTGLTYSDVFIISSSGRVVR
jgi:branched-chain amino acid transport system substrate-binding protein